MGGDLSWYAAFDMVREVLIEPVTDGVPAARPIWRAGGDGVLGPPSAKAIPLDRP